MKLTHALVLLLAATTSTTLWAATDASTGGSAAKAKAAEAPTCAKDKALCASVAGEWRTPEAKARDQYRHPIESLTFWGLKPGMTVLEIQPGGGWWTDILAPYTRMTGGKFCVTAADLSNPKLSDGSRKARAEFEAKYSGKPELYGDVKYVNWGAVSKTLPADTFDFILTARSIHNWMQESPNAVPETFTEFYKALKHGGILAVEQHRANPAGGAEKPETGYVSEAYVIDQAQKAGFRLAARSEINANPKDTKDHPFGVWTLPPALRSSPENSDAAADPKFDHSKYLAIGESDRMTLRFVKP
jgi:predicted methyltransferase